ncbi:MAG: hypothetical protein HDR89_08660 [Bacteroides sp.]|nr:hypothetical protein [Bacteroides sp.]MBD5350936.1 hypothetical protein [Bacteroides sp.]
MMSLFGLPWWFWVALLVVVVVYRITVWRGLASLRRLRPERRELTEKERKALEQSPFKDEGQRNGHR